MLCSWHCALHQTQIETMPSLFTPSPFFFPCLRSLISNALLHAWRTCDGAPPSDRQIVREMAVPVSQLCLISAGSSVSHRLFRGLPATKLLTPHSLKVSNLLKAERSSFCFSSFPAVHRLFLSPKIPLRFLSAFQFTILTAWLKRLHHSTWSERFHVH